MEASFAERRWIYDESKRDLESIVKISERQAKEAKKNLEKEKHRIEKIKREYEYECMINPRKKLSSEEEIAQMSIWQVNLMKRESVVQLTTKVYNALQKQYELLENSKVFIIGPATIDSLLYWAPTDEEEKNLCYEFIREGKLSFPSMFFEFFDPVKFTMPFNQGDKEILGMNITDTKQFATHIKGDETGLRYILSLFYRRYKRIEPGLVVAMNPDKQEVFLGSSEKTRFKIDMKQRVVDFDENYDGIRDYYPKRKTFDSETDAKPFVIIANLATNLVNYINAHNVYVREAGKRKVFSLDASLSPKKSRFKRQPFYVVEVRDEVIDRKERAERSYSLSCQFWVRGHNRRYRNSDGTVKKTIWIRWHKKGPEDAPWKEHRWAVSNQKIEREIAMLKELKGYDGAAGIRTQAAATP